MLSQNERLLRGVEEKMNQLGTEAKEILDRCKKENRDRTEEENAEVTERHEAIQNLKKDADKLRQQIEIDKDVLDVTRGIEVAEEVKVVPEDEKRIKSLGEQFIESKGYKQVLERIREGNGVPQNVSTGPVEVKAGTLLEGAQGAGLIPVPQVIPGNVEKLFERLTIADILPSGQASGNSLRYVVEGTATPGAETVAEGAAKPASDLALSTVDEPVQKIATILTVSDEMLEDAPAVQSYINGRLSLFVKIEEEDQLIRGDGTSPNISGFYDRAINTYAAGTVDNNAVALFKAINGTRGSALLDVDHIFMHPDNWSATRLLTDTAGQFFGGGPFTGAYGGPQGPTNANRLAMDSIWNVPVTITTAVGSGTALLGAFRQAAQLFRRGGLTVEATNSHSDYFTKNLVAIRAEQREALAVYRPAAFTKVTGLD